MDQFKLAIFDFDGTLADSLPFFVSVFNQLAKQHRFGTIDLNNACAFRSYSARQMMEHVGMARWKLPIVTRSFIALMKQNSHMIPVFEGISETLHHLAASGTKLAIVTSNSSENVAAILGKENMALIRHLESGVSIFSKASRITRVIGKSQVLSTNAIYIGDQVSDLEGAHKAKVAFGAVAWGYASIASLLAHKPEHVFYSPSEIKHLLNNGATVSGSAHNNSSLL